MVSLFCHQHAEYRIKLWRGDHYERVCPQCEAASTPRRFYPPRFVPTAAIIDLRHQGLTFPAIAKALGLTTGTAKSRYHYAQKPRKESA